MKFSSNLALGLTIMASYLTQASAYEKDTVVIIKRLTSSPELNGLLGKVTRKFQDGSGTFGVKVGQDGSTHRMRLSGDNLELFDLRENETVMITNLEDDNSMYNGYLCTITKLDRDADTYTVKISDICEEIILNVPRQNLERDYAKEGDNVKIDGCVENKELNGLKGKLMATEIIGDEELDRCVSVGHVDPFKELAPEKKQKIANSIMVDETKMLEEEVVAELIVFRRDRLMKTSMVDVCVQSDMGSTLQLEVDVNASVIHIKEGISRAFAIDCNRQTLLVGEGKGGKLEDGKTLAEYKLQNGSKITCLTSDPTDADAAAGAGTLSGNLFKEGDKVQLYQQKYGLKEGAVGIVTGKKGDKISVKFDDMNFDFEPREIFLDI